MLTSHRYIVGDVFDVLATLPDHSVDLVMTSPPFLALRSYLPADHPDKAKELGAEATPADYLDGMLDVVERCRRVLAPHGSLVFEIGDTYSGSGGAGGDYGDQGMRNGQAKFEGSGRRSRAADVANGILAPTNRPGPEGRDKINGWPLDKSLTGIPTLFSWSLAYGRNLLRPDRQTDQWRIRNIIAWCRPNPPVGALADKMRPATSYLTVATTARDRWFDMDAVRTVRANGGDDRGYDLSTGHPAGAPLLDYWEISTQPYKGSHYATMPEEIPRRVILSMCPERVCVVCDKPSRRITEDTPEHRAHLDAKLGRTLEPVGTRKNRIEGKRENAAKITTGWSDCGHDAWRAGVVLDPFAGSGTTLRMALGNGRSSIGIDIDERNAELARNRIGPMFLDVEELRSLGGSPQ